MIGLMYGNEFGRSLTPVQSDRLTLSHTPVQSYFSAPLEMTIGNSVFLSQAILPLAHGGDPRLDCKLLFG